MQLCRSIKFKDEIFQFIPLLPQYILFWNLCASCSNGFNKKYHRIQGTPSYKLQSAKRIESVQIWLVIQKKPANFVIKLRKPHNSIANNSNELEFEQALEAKQINYYMHLIRTTLHKALFLATIIRQTQHRNLIYAGRKMSARKEFKWQND